MIPGWALPLVISYCGYAPYLTEYQRVYIALKRWYRKASTQRKKQGALKTLTTNKRGETFKTDWISLVQTRVPKALKSERLHEAEAYWFLRQNFLWNPKWRRWEYVFENKRVLQIDSGLLENIHFDANWVRKKDRIKLRRPLDKAKQLLLDRDGPIESLSNTTSLFKQGSLILKYHSDESNTIGIPKDS